MVTAGAAMGLRWQGPVAAVFVGAYVGALFRMVRIRREDLAADRACATVEDLVCGLAADLRAGSAPVTALLAASVVDAGPGHPRPVASRFPGRVTIDPLRELADAANAGLDIPATLRALELPGAQLPLRRLAASWQVSETCGAPLAEVLERLDADLSAGRAQRTQLSAQTGAAMTTVWLLAGLPVVGIALGFGLGADPLRWLFGTPIGAVCGLVALAFQAAGLLWAERLVRGPAGPVARD
jgi:tight adherence protein B